MGRTVKPDLIILDLSLPGGSGFQLAESFRRMPEVKGAPIIIITASRSPELLQRVMDMGAVGLFEKPFDIEKLLYSIEREFNRMDSTQWTHGNPLHPPGRKQDQEGPKQILIIEDDAKIAMALALRLKAAGYRATTAYDALTGLNAAMSNHPALVLMDISMPAGNGFSVAERIQALIPTPDPDYFHYRQQEARVSRKGKTNGGGGIFREAIRGGRACWRDSTGVSLITSLISVAQTC